MRVMFARFRVALFRISKAVRRIHTQSRSLVPGVLKPAVDSAGPRNLCPEWEDEPSGLALNVPFAGFGKCRRALPSKILPITSSCGSGVGHHNVLIDL